MPLRSHKLTTYKGLYHLTSKEYKENIKLRASLHLQEQFPELCDASWEMARRDCIYFINHYCLTYDPRKPKYRSCPFNLYDYQEDLIRWDIEACTEGRDNLVLKSRDTGLSWCLAAVDLWYFIFSNERIEILWGSRKESYVDSGVDGDTSSIFNKFRFMLNHLPEGKVNYTTSHMKLINSDTGSAVTGESANANFARGGRKLRVRLDEYAFWQFDKSVWEGTADVAQSRTVISTPNGVNNTFCTLATGEMDIMPIHWSQHPTKGLDSYYIENDEKITCTDPYQDFKDGKKVLSPWYVEEVKRRKDPVSIARELDLSFGGSSGDMLLSINDILVNDKITIVSPDVSNTRRIVAIDPSRSGADLSVMYGMENNVIIAEKIEQVVNHTINTANAISLATKIGAFAYAIDRGEGSGIIDNLREIHKEDHRVQVLEVGFGDSAIQRPDRYANLRAEMFCFVEKLIKEHKLKVPMDQDLRAELCSISYTIDSRGRVLLVSKKELKKLIGKSTDRADSYVIGVYWSQFVRPLESFEDKATDFGRNKPKRKQAKTSIM